MSRFDEIMKALKFEAEAYGTEEAEKAILCDEMIAQCQNEVYSLKVWE